MKIRFDTSLRIAGIGLVPWNRLGPEQWFPRYAIASLYDWDIHSLPKVPALFSLSSAEEALPQLSTLSTHALLRAPAFQRLLQTKLADYDLLTYKPVAIPPELTNRKFLMTQSPLSKVYENKVLFRQKFSKDINFPPFIVRKRQELLATPEYYAVLLAGRTQLVLQDEQLSGGRGTFIVTSYDEYAVALKALDRLSGHQYVVVSDVIAGAKERSIQCCVTQAGVITGPLQRQLVRQPSLSNSDIPGSDQFCGAQIISTDQQTDLHRQAIAIAERVGHVLQQESYRGIFGIDFLLAQTGELFVLEVNPRITGVTPLVTALYRGEAGVPFYLLHLLELGNYEYTIDEPSIRFDQDGALLVLHSLGSSDVVLDNMPQSGTYNMVDDKVALVSRNLDLQVIHETEFIVQSYMPEHAYVKAGGRLVTLLFKRPVIDINTDKLYNDTIKVVNAVRQHIKARPVS